MTQFEINQLIVEGLTLWLGWAGVIWFGLGLWYLIKKRTIQTSLALMISALIGLGLIFVLTTSFIWDQEIIPIDIVSLLRKGLPYYLALGVAGATTLVVKGLLEKTVIGLILVLASLTLIPLSLAIQVVSNFDSIHLFPPQTSGVLAATPPFEPVVNKKYPDMVVVPAGPFIRGSLSPLQLQKIIGNQEGDEHPVRTIYLDAFLIDRLEITNARFARFVEATDYITDPERLGGGNLWGEEGWYFQPGAQWRHPAGLEDSIEGQADHPVVQVSWNDARAYCEWLGKRLPTEAEWEKAARGPDGRDFPWGSKFDPSLLNYCDQECKDLPQYKDNKASDGFSRTSPVGSFQNGASPYGVLDMAGNVWEWVQDWYDPYYYRYSPATNPQGPKEYRSYQQSKVVRGGSWTSQPGYTRTTSRSFDPPDWSAFGVGFRCALTL